MFSIVWAKETLRRYIPVRKLGAITFLLQYIGGHTGVETSPY